MSRSFNEILNGGCIMMYTEYQVEMMRNADVVKKLKTSVRSLIYEFKDEFKGCAITCYGDSANLAEAESKVKSQISAICMFADTITQGNCWGEISTMWHNAVDKINDIVTRVNAGEEVEEA